MKLSKEDCQATHPSSQWRYKLVQEVLKISEDTDQAVGEWLEQGCPMGISEDIATGGWFPTLETYENLTPDQLVEQEVFTGNHPSFSLLHGEDESPAVSLVTEHVYKGFGILFADQASAEEYYNSKCHPTPLGNITKEKPGGGE